MNGYFEEINKSKHQLTLVATNESREYEELWSKIIDLIKSRSKKNQIIMIKNTWKSNFDWHGESPLNKIIEIPGMIIVIRGFFFFDNDKYYAQLFLDERLCKLEPLVFIVV